MNRIPLAELPSTGLLPPDVDTCHIHSPSRIALPSPANYRSRVYLVVADDLPSVVRRGAPSCRIGFLLSQADADVKTRRIRGRADVSSVLFAGIPTEYGWSGLLVVDRGAGWCVHDFLGTVVFFSGAHG